MDLIDSACFNHNFSPVHMFLPNFKSGLLDFCLVKSEYFAINIV